MPPTPEATTVAPPPSPAPRTRPWRRRLRVLLGVGALLAITGAALLLQQHQAEAERLRPVLPLLDRMTGGDFVVRRAARDQLVLNPATAAPLLVNVITSEKDLWSSGILPWLDHVPLVADHRNRQQGRERAAIEALQRMGPRASGAVIPLLEENRFGGRETAIALLRSHGPTAVPVITQALAHATPDRRIGAALALGRFTPPEMGGIGPLVGGQEDPEPGVRAASTWALAQMHAFGEDVIPRLVHALDDPVEAVRLQGVQGLAYFGPAAAPSVEPLRRLLRESPGAIEPDIARTLAMVGPTARSAEPELLALLRRAPPGLVASRQAAVTLVELDLHVAESLEHLRGLLAHPDPAFRVRTLHLLAGLGERARPVGARVLELLGDDDPRDDRAALFTLRSIAPDSIPEHLRRPPGRGR